MSHDWGSPYGFSFRRNGSCLSTETDCGQTWPPFHACCPNGTHCPTQDNVKCCPSDADCSDLFKERPHCANSTGNLLKANGYFCCPPGTVGFSKKENGWVGCAEFVEDVGEEYNLLATISTGQISTSTPITSSIISSTSLVTSTSPTTPTTVLPTNTATLTSSTINPGSSSPQINTGAVAGGVVGGVAGFAIIACLLWFYIRRRAASLRQGPRASSYSYGSGALKAVTARNSVPQELDCHDGAQPPRYELGADSTPTQPEMSVNNRL